jgi:hypothetical protein
MPGAEQSVETLAMDWARCIQAAEEFTNKYPENIITTHYEHLVSDPENQLRLISEFLNLPYHPEMATGFSTQYSSCTLPRENSWKENAAKGELINREGVWKERLKPAQASVIEKAIQPIMAQYGYGKEKES